MGWHSTTWGLAKGKVWLTSLKISGGCRLPIREVSAFDRGRQQGSLERDGKLSSLYIRDFQESDVVVMLGKETIDFRCDPTTALQRVGIPTIFSSSTRNARPVISKIESCSCLGDRHRLVL